MKVEYEVIDSDSEVRFETDRLSDAVWFCRLLAMQYGITATVWAGDREVCSYYG